MSERLELHIRNDLVELGRVHRQLEEFGRALGLSAADSAAVDLAVDELLTNIISYAFPAGETHEVRLRAQLDGRVLTVELEDDGCPFDPTAVPAPQLESTLEDRSVGGLGIHLARRLVDGLSYRRHDDRNRLTLTKRLAAGTPGAAASAPETALVVEVAAQYGAIVFEVAGRLAAPEAARLEERLRAELAAGVTRFLFDCQRLEYLSSAGLRVLLIAAKAAAAAGGRVALAAPRPEIQQTIEMAGLSHALPSFAERAHALAALGGGA